MSLTHSTYPRHSSSIITALFTSVWSLKNITYLNVYLLKSSEIFIKLKVITSEVFSYCERVDQDDSVEMKACKALKQLRPFLSHVRVIAVNL